MSNNHNTVANMAPDGGSLPPASGHVGGKVSTTLKGITARIVGSAVALDVAIVDSSGAQVSLATQATLLKLVKLAITEHDYIALTYVAAGDGIGEIETVTYKLGGSGGTTVATVTLGYNGDDKLVTITKT